ncbi:Peptidoglycan-binding domain 1 protein [Caldalkalibacillus thermarum TA2.A1]|uniref:Peptidoglycan-binding domain 1 protein n=2 Tax=Caldalkalibacillus TaxID=379065 RepID=F5L300_CALTT|nr:Peptidoglycan-binding domain 1 protein [Caldalkalibacillus thermarum TA2.A1]
MIQSGASPRASSSSILLRFGDKGEAVRKLQQDLIAAGEKLPKYGADGHFGAETEAAVKSFQAKHGLTVDGIAGPKTLAKLAEVISSQNKPQTKEEESDMLKAAVVVNSYADFPIAEGVAKKYKAPIFLRDIAVGEIAETVYIVGGSAEGIKAKKMVNLSGKNRYETAQKVGRHLGQL